MNGEKGKPREPQSPDNLQAWMAAFDQLGTTCKEQLDEYLIAISSAYAGARNMLDADRELHKSRTAIDLLGKCIKASEGCYKIADLSRVVTRRAIDSNLELGGTVTRNTREAMHRMEAAPRESLSLESDRPIEAINKAAIASLLQECDLSLREVAMTSVRLTQGTTLMLGILYFVLRGVKEADDAAADSHALRELRGAGWDTVMLWLGGPPGNFNVDWVPLVGRIASILRRRRKEIDATDMRLIRYENAHDVLIAWPQLCTIVPDAVDRREDPVEAARLWLDQFDRPTSAS